MSSNVPLYATVTPDTSRGLMADLWRDSLQAYVSNDPRFGTRISDDFKKPRTNTTDATAVDGWFIQDATAGGTNENFTSVAGADGIATLSATTGTDHFGIELHYGDGATNLGTVALITHGTAAARRGRVVYQSRADMNTLDTYFVGLTEPIVEFLSATSGLPANSDYIGFYRNDDGALRFVCANDNNGGTAVTDEVEIMTAAEVAALEAASGNWFNFGFAVNVDGSVDIVVNGKNYRSLAKQISRLALPIEYLTPKYAITRGPTGDRATVSIPLDDIHVFVAAG